MNGCSGGGGKKHIDILTNKIIEHRHENKSCSACLKDQQERKKREGVRVGPASREKLSQILLLSLLTSLSFLFTMSLTVSVKKGSRSSSVFIQRMSTPDLRKTFPVCRST